MDQELQQQAIRSNRILVTHVNIRESISILLLKLVFLDIAAYVCVIGFYFFLRSGFAQEAAFLSGTPLSLFIFLFLVLIKIAIFCMVILNWLNEYYEVSPKTIEYRRGIIFRTRDNYSFTHIRSVRIDQGIFGKIFNYGTLTLFDWDLRKNFVMDKIHNPMKHLQLLEELLPNINMEKHLIRDRFIDVEKE